MNVTQKLIQSHLVYGEMKPGEEIGIRIDQTLNQDATGTLVMLELGAMGLDRVKTELSVQYVDLNIIPTQQTQAAARNHGAPGRFGGRPSPEPEARRADQGGTTTTPRPSARASESLARARRRWTSRSARLSAQQCQDSELWRWRMDSGPPAERGRFNLQRAHKGGMEAVIGFES